jgi:RNA-directed DNA polymerase
MDHSFVLKRLGRVPGRELIKPWLKAGYVDAEIFHATTAGVQQGGVISPLIANMALDGLEQVLAGKAGYIRYADDFVVTAKSKEQIEALLPTVEAFLAERGLELNAEKTRIVHVKDGFSFLSFNVRSYNGKCLVRPQKEKVQSFLKEIRTWLKTAKPIPPAAIISHLNPMLRGWSNYYKKVNSKDVLTYFEHQVWHAVWQWCLSRHPKKSKHWVLRRALLQKQVIVLTFT